MDQDPPKKKHKAGHGSQAAAAAVKSQAAAAEPAAAVPYLEHLLQAPSGLQGHLSPGAMHGNRIVAFAAPDAPGFGAAAVFANGPNVYLAHIQTSATAKDSDMPLGKDGILIPVALPAPPAQHMQQLVHAAEVQDVTSQPLPDGQFLLATVDCHGQTVLAHMQHPGQLLVNQHVPEGMGLSAVQALRPTGPPREAGWAGVSISQGTTPLVAMARSFARDVHVWDAGTGSIVRRFGLALQPYAVKYLPAMGGGGSLLAVAESHLISIWDARAGESGGCVQRVAVGSPGQPLYGLEWCCSGSGLLGAAGAERAVTLIEPRKWRTQHKWPGAARQALHHLSFLEADPRFCCCWGLDFEVLCGRWDKPLGVASGARPFPTNADDDGVPQPLPADRPGFSFRGDSRWLGVAKAAGADVLAGLGASGNLVYASVGNAKSENCMEA